MIKSIYVCLHHIGLFFNKIYLTRHIIEIIINVSNIDYSTNGGKNEIIR